MLNLRPIYGYHQEQRLNAYDNYVQRRIRMSKESVHAENEEEGELRGVSWERRREEEEEDDEMTLALGLTRGVGMGGVRVVVTPEAHEERMIQLNQNLDRIERLGKNVITDWAKVS